MINCVQQVHESHHTSGTRYSLFAFRIPMFSSHQIYSHFLVKYHVPPGLIEHLFDPNLHHSNSCVYKLLDVLDASCYKPRDQPPTCSYREHMHNLVNMMSISSINTNLAKITPTNISEMQFPESSWKKPHY
uniref:Uncharacterized protein n=1 Tax=Glossina pallidipes TaxID=7398 RepID=A0A1B0A0C1_GLOPL